MVHDNRILILTPTGRDGAASAEVLSRGGLQPEVCATLPDLLASLALRPAPVLVAEEALLQQDLTGLYAWVDLQPTWSDLPFVVLTTTALHYSIEAWRQRLIAALRNVSLLERPVQSITLLSAVKSACRARQHQFDVRTLLESQLRAAEDLEHLVQARTQQLEASNRELHKQAMERERIEASLRQAQKLEALGQLTGGVAHDFNNLLMVILGGLEMIERRADPAQQEVLMDGMRQAAQRGAALTRQLLTFSRGRALQPQPTDLAQQIENLHELLTRSLRGDVQVQLELADDLWIVEVDPGELELVVLNLAVNARDAMPTGGTLRVIAHNVSEPATDGRSADYVRLSVIDSGTGMTPEVKEHVFEPFFTTKDPGKGSGLGLAHVYGFATQSGGTVQIDTELGRGTTVSILLPRSLKDPVTDEGAARMNAASSVAGTRSFANASVLLVEDSDDVATLAGEMLLELGCEVFRTASAAAALDTLQNGRQFDLVFSDIMMPGDMNGVDLAKEIRIRGLRSRVLLTSGYAGPAKKVAEAEGFEVLAKPYRMNELAAALARALNGSTAAPVPR